MDKDKISLIKSKTVLLDNLFLGHCIIQKDYQVVFWNKCLEFWTLVKKEDIEGKKITEVFPDIFRSPLIEKGFLSVFDNKSTVSFPSRMYKSFIPIKLKDAGKRFHDTLIMPLNFSEIDETFALVTIQDVTDFISRIKKYEQLYNEVKDRFLSENSDRQKMDKILKEQAEQLIDTGKQLQLQQQNLNFINEELEKKTSSLEEKGREIEKKNKVLNFTKHALEMKAKELELANKYKSEFLANMSHELRTPLNSMLILSKDLAVNKDNKLTTEEVDSLKVIYESGKELLHLINDILDLSKVEAGKLLVNPDIVILENIVKDMPIMYKHSLEKKGLELKIEMADDVPSQIKTDAQRLRQILKNLITNAIKFTPKGNITVKFYLPKNVELKRKDLDVEDLIAISVTDTGIGIEQSKQEKIFEAFRQEDGSTSRQYGGTGLGLSISRELAKLLNGEIHLESKRGVGSTFTLYISKSLEEENMQDSNISEQSHDGNGVFSLQDSSCDISLKGRTVLVAEDDMRSLFALSKVLRERGAKVIKCADGKEALDVIKSGQHIDIILSDIMMPEMDGYNLIKKIREKEQFKDLPIIAVTALIDKDSEEKCFEMGANCCVTKPINIDVLFSSMQKYLKI